jgi:integrase
MTNITTFSALSTSLKSPNTSKIYTVALNDFMRYRKATNLSELLENETKTKLLESDIIEFLVYLKLERKTSWSFRNVRLSAIKHFYRMNDIELNWFKISKYLGEYNKVAHDRAHTTEEIQQLLTKCDDRMRVVILLLASTGMRIGAIPDLKIGNLTKIQKYNLYQIVVYENSNEEYYCFCSPECAIAIDSYLAYRERYGEKLKPNSPLIREQFNTNDLLKISHARSLQNTTIQDKLRIVLTSSGVTTVKHQTESTLKGREHKDVARSHGFRKFVTTNMIRANLNPEAREMLLGHSIGLSNSYYKPSSDELLDEYLKAVNLLTINEENRLRIKVKEMQLYHSKELDSIVRKVEELEKRFGGHS